MIIHTLYHFFRCTGVLNLVGYEVGNRMHPALKGIVYRLDFQPDKFIHRYYVGSSLSSLEERWMWHQMKPLNTIKFRDFQSKHGSIRTIPCTVSVLEEVIVPDTFENLCHSLLSREGYWIKTLGTHITGLNSLIPTTTEKVVKGMIKRKPYECSTCKWRFHSKTLLDEHTLPDSKPDARFFCFRKSCRQVFTTLDDLWKHFGHHELYFPCIREGCFQKISRQKDLLHHLKQCDSTLLQGNVWKIPF